MIKVIKYGGYKFIFWIGDCNCHVDSRRDNTPLNPIRHKDFQYSDQTNYSMDELLDQYIEFKTTLLYWSIHYQGMHLLTVKDDY